MRTKIKLNIPNVLTFIRFLLVPVAVVFVLRGELLSGFVVYAIACITDILDGVIARKFNMITQAGMLLDPLADKCMTMSMVITFTILGVLPLFILIFVIIKELLMIAGGIMLYKNNIVTSANIFGKIAAMLFNLSIALTFFYKIVGKSYLHIMYLAMALSLAALIQYFYFNMYKKYFKIKNEISDKETDELKKI
jgi:cardiolipin synthase (CMP-forming)